MRHYSSRLVSLLMLSTLSVASGCSKGPAPSELVGHWVGNLNTSADGDRYPAPLLVSIQESGEIIRTHIRSSSESEAIVQQESIGHVSGQGDGFSVTLSVREGEAEGALAQTPNRARAMNLIRASGQLLSPSEGMITLDNRRLKQDQYVVDVIGREGRDAMPDETTMSFRRVSQTRYEKAIREKSMSPVIDAWMKVPEDENSGDTADAEGWGSEPVDTLLPGDVSDIFLHISGVSVVEVRPGTRTRPERETPVQADLSTFPDELSLSRAYWHEGRRSGDEGPSVQMTIDGGAGTMVGYSGSRLTGLRSSEEHPLEFIPTGLSYMSCSQWGVARSRSNIFRSDLLVSGRDTAKVVLNEDGSVATVSFECRIQNRTRRYTLTYTQAE